MVTYNGVLARRSGRPRDVTRLVPAALNVAIWAILVAGSVVGLVLDSGGGHASPGIVTTVLSVFFIALLLRLAVAIVLTPRRRRALTVLIVSVAVWSVGSAILNASAHPDLTRFPSPGEWFFLVSAVGMAAYLIIDSANRMDAGLAAWLDAIVVCGGTACLAGALLVSPLTSGLSTDGVALLLALLYPLIDIMLALVVVGQIALRARTLDRQSIALCLGFLCFAAADSHFVTNLTTGTYRFSLLGDAGWGIGFGLLVWSACRPVPTGRSAVPRQQGPLVMVGAALIALTVVTLRPVGMGGLYLTVPAVLTMLAAGGRMVLALRAANGAAEAFALSRTDDLTRLPNRRAVLARLDEGLASDAPLALLMLDLDGFKDVNDTLGHAAGDTFLELAAHRMRESMPPEVLVARLGGDEFAVVVSTADAITLMEVAQAVLDAVRQPAVIDGVEIATQASIGATLRAPADTVSTALLRRADVAMYQAKLTRAGALLYDPHADHFSREKLQLAEDLRKGILNGQLTLWYQPQIDAATQGICGLEALVRWQHPEQGLLPPIAFLPAARRAGLMPMLSEAVARMAVADLERWHSHGLSMRVALNCAPPELTGGVFLSRLFDLVDHAGLPADSLVIEVTEDSFLADPERTRELLRDIRRHGLQIAIDDYGTGFSSLSYLRDLPVQELKMDRSFIASMRADSRSRMIVASTFQMARALGLRMVAEGVEDAATAADLVAMGVDVLQGYHVARPMPVAEVEAWVRRWANLSEAHFGSLGLD